MRKEAEKGWRDPELVEHFIALLENGGSLIGLEKERSALPH